jgi:hypothetical protein
LLLTSCAHVNRQPDLVATKDTLPAICSPHGQNITGLKLVAKTPRGQKITINKTITFPFHVGDKLILPAKVPREVLLFNDKLVIFAEIMHDGEDAFILSLISFKKTANESVRSSLSYKIIKLCQESEFVLQEDSEQLFVNTRLELIGS